jgi:hypothetical protein
MCARHFQTAAFRRVPHVPGRGIPGAAHRQESATRASTNQSDGGRAARLAHVSQRQGSRNPFTLSGPLLLMGGLRRGDAPGTRRALPTRSRVPASTPSPALPTGGREPDGTTASRAPLNAEKLWVPRVEAAQTQKRQRPRLGGRAAAAWLGPVAALGGRDELSSRVWGLEEPGRAPATGQRGPRGLDAPGEERRTKARTPPGEGAVGPIAS